MELTIKIKDKDFDKVTTLLKTLDVEIIESNTPASIMSEPMAKYGQKKRPSADEIEQMIIKKAMLDAKAIERGELKGLKAFNNYKDLIADLEAEIENEK